MMKKRYVFAKKNVHGWDASTRLAHGHRIREMARTQPHSPTQTDRIRTKRTSVWDRAMELSLAYVETPYVKVAKVWKSTHHARKGTVASKYNWTVHHTYNQISQVPLNTFRLILRTTLQWGTTSVYTHIWRVKLERVYDTRSVTHT